MTEPADQPELHVTADLRLDVDGVEVRIAGDGQRIDVSTDHPLRLMSAAARTPSPRGAFAVVANVLADSGVTVEVKGSHGAVARAGLGVDSRLGRVATGSSHVRVVVDPRLLFAAGAAVVVALAVGVARYRRP